MPIAPLKIPPGVYKNSEDYGQRGRWASANLVRWYTDAVEQLGGWLRRTDTSNVDIPALVADPTVEVVRDVYSWRDLDQVVRTIFGSNSALYYMDATGAITTITPAGATSSSKDASLEAGYGQGLYGQGIYGVANTLTGADAVPVLRWSITNFGELPLFCQRGTGSLYEMNLTTLATSAVTNAPTDSNWVVVTPDGFVMLLEPDNESRRVEWSDRRNRTVWSATTSNQAGGETLTGTGTLRSAYNTLSETLILSDNDAIAARYVGPPYVYEFDVVGTNCGIASPDAGVATDRFVVWFGLNTFWLYDGTVQPLQCDVLEYITSSIDYIQRSKINCFTVQDFHEVWWIFQSDADDDPDTYVTWNYREQHWNYGTLTRSAAIDRGALNSVLMVDHDGIIYNHEQKGVMPDGEAFVETGPIDIADGAQNVAVHRILMDTLDQDATTVTITGAEFPTGTDYTYGPYSYTNPVETRAMGRQLKFRFDANDASFRIGLNRIEYTTEGRQGTLAR